MYCFITTSSGTRIVTALSQAILFKVSKGNISLSGSSAPLHKVTLLQAVCHEAMPGCGMACRVGFICGARGWHDLFFTSLSADGQTASGSVLEVEFLQSARGFWIQIGQFVKYLRSYYNDKYRTAKGKMCVYQSEVFSTLLVHLAHRPYFQHKRYKLLTLCIRWLVVFSTATQIC